MRGVRLLLLLVAAALPLLSSPAAWAVCSGFSNVTASISPSPSVASYDPFAAGDKLLSMTVTVTNASKARCDAAVSFTRAAGASAVMTLGGSTLSYGVEGTGGNSLITTTGFINLTSPPAGNRIDFANIAAGSSRQATVTLRVPTSQIVAAGTYADTGIAMDLVALDNQNRPTRLIQTVAFQPNATVVAKCVLPAPPSPNLDFSAAITVGRPNSAYVLRKTFTNVACTAPTRLRLSGAALQPTSATPARTGFDNYINYRAAGVFGSANATLTTTTTTASVDSASKNTASGATTNGTIDVDVNLVTGNPIIAGAYSGILTVTIDPAL